MGNRQSGAHRQTPVIWLFSPVWRLWVGCHCFRRKQHVLQRCYLQNTAGYENTCITLESLETNKKKRLWGALREISRNTEGLKKEQFTSQAWPKIKDQGYAENTCLAQWQHFIIVYICPRAIAAVGTHWIPIKNLIVFYHIKVSLQYTVEQLDLLKSCTTHTFMVKFFHFFPRSEEHTSELQSQR